MRFKAIFAAIGLTVAALGMTSAAEARDRWDDRRWSDNRRWDHDRHWKHDRNWRQERRWDRDRRWDRRWDRRHYSQRGRCWNEWHRGHRVRVCR